MVLTLEDELRIGCARIKQVFFGKIVKFVTADLKKSFLIPTCAPISELASIISTMTEVT